MKFILKFTCLIVLGVVFVCASALLNLSESDSQESTPIAVQFGDTVE